MPGLRTRRFVTHAFASALAFATPASFVAADVIFSDDFESTATNSQVAWSSVSDNNNAGDPTVKFRVTSAADPFETGSPDTNHYLLAKDTQNNAGGSATQRNIAGASNVATLSFDFIEPTRAGGGTRLYLHVGETGATLGSDSERAYQFYLNNGTWTTNGNPTSASYSLDVKHSAVVVMNYSASSIDYTGFGGAQESLGSGRYDLYIDGVLALEDATRYVNGANPTLAIGTALSAFNLQSFTGDANQEVLLDNLVLQTGAVVPEPAAIGLLGLGLGTMVLRRN